MTDREQRQKGERKEKRAIGRALPFAAVIIVGIAALGFGLSLTGFFVQPAQYDGLSKCLTEKGVVMYGSSLCGACAKQKQALGGSFQFIDYIECSGNPAACQEAGIDYLPTWVYQGKKYI
ncbi:MAG: hypothetical protein ACOY58_03000, partial [Candidatus Micrarchaeota archaeon]